jgi:hypothetical protein
MPGTLAAGRGVGIGEIPDRSRYRIVVLADHGQSQGATFLQRYGETLEDVVRAA